MTFDYIVSNPPFKLDFSDFRNDLDTKQNHDRFFAGIPKITKQEERQDGNLSALYSAHYVFAYLQRGKAAIVVPTGFITRKVVLKRKYGKNW